MLRTVKYDAAGGMVVVGTCSTRCPPEVAISTTRGLLSMLQPKSIVVISELHEQDVSKASLQEVQHDFYCLGTSETSAMSGGLHELSAGCTITGMAAAVLSAAEVRTQSSSCCYSCRIPRLLLNGCGPSMTLGLYCTGT